MTEKLIIENLTKLPLIKLMPRVLAILADGRRYDNGRRYCNYVSWTDGIYIVTRANKKSDTFVIYKEER